MSGADKDRETREELIIELKAALETPKLGNLFMDEDGEIYESTEAAAESADSGEVITLSRYVQITDCFVAVTDNTVEAFLTQEEAEAKVEEDD